jgi:hypothetical protein
VVSVGVAVVIAWYTKETQLIRKQGQSQLGILQAQLQLGLAPYLIARVIEYAQGGQHVPHTALKNIRASHRCQICNPTDRPAHHVNALVYTANGNYFWSDQGFDSLGRTDGQDLVALGPLTRDDAIRAIQLLQSLEEWSNRCEQMRGKLGVWKSFDAKYSEGSQTPISVSAYGQALFTTGVSYHLGVVWHLNGGRAQLFRMVLQRKSESILIPPSFFGSRPFVDPPSIRERELGIQHG